MLEKKKRNVIIISLCGVLLLMTIGYAAFNTLLNINGTTSITSNWDIKITSITSKDIVGKATDEDSQVVDDLSATFKVNLVSPGDSITYEIAVENNGNIDAEVARVKLSEPENDAIKFETNGIEESEILTANGGTDILTVKVTYSDEITKQPDNLEASFTVTLDYIEKGKKSEWVPIDGIIPAELVKNLTTEGDGLYADTYESGRYIYKGVNPSNYITFNNQAYRIIAIETDGTLKIMPNERINVLNWDSGGSNTWASSSLKAYLNDTYYNGITANKSAIISHDWYAGVLSSASINMSAEKSTIVTDYVGIPSVSDYLKAGGKSSWMNKAGLYYWLINPYYNTYSHNIFFVDASRSGELGIYGNPSELSSVFPAIFLKADTRISGDGQEDHPYIIENYKL